MPTSTPDSGTERVGVPLDPQLADLHHLGFKLVLFGLWFAVSFGVSYFAEALQFQVGPWPFSYWVAAQGGVLVFILLTWVYYLGMRHYERSGKAGGREPQQGSQ
ncbi:DUF4212 domain-containing protein [Comamonas sp. NLF-1-9]|uniref:DUF4212 domain-containing protein n=1 Tax=Comamonas sp. NLF-1-9 TaxID=2853163 RepID=UPI001C45FD57|nr:sodium/substrate symporter small subunit [Comamonas sp. NLF-1-9]QXL85447.1 DUF4212 domain-containing protein [Comamonas sp. NLF-1-9]